MKKKTGLALLAAGVAGALGCVYASKKLTRGLMNTALDRDEPRLIKKVTAGLIDSAMDKEPYKGAAEAARRLSETSCETVEIKAYDGVSLVGHYYEAKEPQRVVLAMHGWRSSWTRDFGAVADFWHENGCSVLFVEQRGQGNSGGEHMGFGMRERYDCLFWVRWICENIPELSIYLSGVSMGASTVLMASGLELPDRVCGITADCGFTSARDIFRHITKNHLHLSYELRREDVEKICREKIQVGTEDYTTKDALLVNTRPVLFIHGTEDSFVPIEHTYENYKACHAPKHLLIVPGADHGASYLRERERYEKELLDFYEKYDRYWEKNDEACCNEE